MMGNGDMKDILEKAKEMQKNLARKKEEAANKTVEVSVGGGMVQVVMNGNMETLSVKIDPEIVDKDDVETLEDLIRAASNEAARQAKELFSTGLSDLMTDMKIPNLNDLFKK
ncbi:MAG: YbaB/EbfC family nucleoid-associated protein [Proteobacteria bacterium]|nr:YbaB/EbfC family nucleoid-associated protein [Pseudomonadota bacterium]